MIEEEEEHPEHNAGRMALARDGDSTSGNGDDLNDANHQTRHALFAGIFRIDVDSDAARSHLIPEAARGRFTTGYMIPERQSLRRSGRLESSTRSDSAPRSAFSFDRQTNDL